MDILGSGVSGIDSIYKSIYIHAFHIGESFHDSRKGFRGNTVLAILGKFLVSSIDLVKVTAHIGKNSHKVGGSLYARLNGGVVCFFLGGI